MQALLAPAVVPLGHKRRVNDLTATCDKAPIEQLSRYAVEQRLRADLANLASCSYVAFRFGEPVFGCPALFGLAEEPARRSIPAIRRPDQAVKALVAHTMEQMIFPLPIRQLVQAFQDLAAYRRLSWRRRTTPCAHRTRSNAIKLCRRR